MFKLTISDAEERPTEIKQSSDELARQGARRLVLAAVKLEVEQYVQALRHARDEQGQAMAMGNGKSHHEPTVSLEAGPVSLRAPRVDDRCPEHRLTGHGIGTANPTDWASPYFAPNGRPKRWKLRQRALVEAYRTTLGSPSQDDIIALRRHGSEYLLSPGDFDHIADDLAPHQQPLIAHRRAARRLGQDPVDPIAEALRVDNRSRNRNRIFKT